MVSAGAFCIDRTEVSYTAYKTWLKTTGGPITITSPQCAWKTDFAPGCTPSVSSGPVSCVDYCDAETYCVNNGKSLCGAITGGTVIPALATDPTHSQWYAACTNHGATTFPYGSDYQPAACNGNDTGTGASVAPGSLPGCEGGIKGLYDMSGNLAEWENSCSDGLCLVRGGQYLSEQSQLRCSASIPLKRNERFPTVGFRCCLREPLFPSD